MDHQYSFTDRMRALFVGGSVLLGLLLFGLGLVVAHQWWPAESKDAAPVEARALRPKSAASGVIRLDPAPAPIQDKSPAPAASTSGTPASQAVEPPSAAPMERDAGTPSPAAPAENK